MSESSQRILITGARAPVAVEWARLGLKHGHQVYVTDCLHYPLARFVKGISAFIRTPPPKQNFAGYRQAILELIDRHAIQMVIPTCEEVFYLARIAEYRPDTNWLMPDISLLGALHNKLTVFEQLIGLPGIKLPKTRQVIDKKEITTSADTILKPLYSRFGTHVVRNVTPETIRGLDLSSRKPWVQQQKLTGRSICLYAIFDHGRLIGMQSYVPRYCVNHSAASYFAPASDERINSFVKAFGERYSYHGQVSFDFLEHHDELYVIECNPRATSGLHLLADHLSWTDGHLSSAPTGTESHRDSQAKHLGAIMLVSDGFASLCKRRSWREFFAAPSVLSDPQFPLTGYAQTLGLAEIAWHALRQHRSLSSVTTFDIEWDGHPEC